MIEFPHDVPLLVRKRKGLIRTLSDQGSSLAPVRLGIMGGSTTQEVAAWIELFLLERGIRPIIHQSEYNRYFEDTVVDSSELAAFVPDILYLHLSTTNLALSRQVIGSEEEFERAIGERMEHFRRVWQSVWSVRPCLIVQNTFEPPALRPLGHLDASSCNGQTRFARRLNEELAREARAESRLVLHDAASLPATSSVANWFAPDRWASYKMPTSLEADVVIGHSVASLIAAAFGRSRKCLVLDLDNTLWGGVIGDDGPERIVVGRETPRGEAFTAFQEYCKALRERGVILAVCSKNDDATARLGFAHPDSVLQLSDISAFRANWEPKPDNIRSIAQELNIGLDSVVFVDDNPAERLLVAGQLPMVAVPNVGSEVSRFAPILDSARYFEAITISREDLERTRKYAENADRAATVQKFANYGEYLDSLHMVAEIDAFSDTYLDRIAQLTNKTNQFNLTTRRYTKAEIAELASDQQYVTLYGRLVDTFGDNGLVSVIIGRREGSELHIDLWLMSCRVLKRGMEAAMLDALVARAQELGCVSLIGKFIPTDRNGMVAAHYEILGFDRAGQDAAKHPLWALDISGTCAPRNLHIKEMVRD